LSANGAAEVAELTEVLDEIAAARGRRAAKKVVVARRESESAKESRLRRFKKQDVADAAIRDAADLDIATRGVANAAAQDAADAIAQDAAVQGVAADAAVQDADSHPFPTEIYSSPRWPGQPSPRSCLLPSDARSPVPLVAALKKGIHFLSMPAASFPRRWIPLPTKRLEVFEELAALQSNSSDQST
jgi:hypothetical protein